jgi:hypothetical protein
VRMAGKSFTSGNNSLTFQNQSMTVPRMGAFRPLSKKSKNNEFICPICSVEIPTGRIQAHARMHASLIKSIKAGQPVAAPQSQGAPKSRRQKRDSKWARQAQALLGQVKFVHRSDYTHCKRCGLRVLKTALRDHVQMACKERGHGPATAAPWGDMPYDAHWNPW